MYMQLSQSDRRSAHPSSSCASSGDNSAAAAESLTLSSKQLEFMWPEDRDVNCGREVSSGPHSHSHHAHGYTHAYAHGYHGNHANSLSKNALSERDRFTETSKLTVRFFEDNLHEPLWDALLSCLEALPWCILYHPVTEKYGINELNELIQRVCRKRKLFGDVTALRPSPLSQQLEYVQSTKHSVKTLLGKKGPRADAAADVYGSIDFRLAEWVKDLPKNLQEYHFNGN